MSSPLSSKSQWRVLLGKCVSAILFLGVVLLWWPEAIPFEVFGAPFWGRELDIPGAVREVWWIFAWAFGTSLVAELGRNDRLIKRVLRQESTPGEILTGGTLRSFLAGTIEELSFRWIVFLGAIPGLLLANWLLGGIFGIIGVVVLAVVVLKTLDDHEWLGIFLAGLLVTGALVLTFTIDGFDPLIWLYSLLIPIADFATLGALHEHLYHPHSWAVGAAILSSNAVFRDGHKYQGPFGIINSWFGGMVLFWVMFNYGLLAAMCIHFLYDFVYFCTIALIRHFR